MRFKDPSFIEGVKRQHLLEKMRAKVKVEKEISSNLRSEIVGQIRERKVFESLTCLKNQRKILNFLQTGKYGYNDLIKGIDFLFTYIDPKEQNYTVCYFFVTGPKWVKKHSKKHPEVPVISVRVNESQESVCRKILKLIK